MELLALWTTFLLLLSLIVQCFAVSTASIACGACIMVVTELENSIAKAGKKKMEKIGHYRIDDVQHAADKVPYARSELYLSDELETVCDKSSEWTAVIHPVTGKGIYARRASLNLKQVPNHPNIYQLSDACSDFLDGHEEQLLTFVHKKHEEPVRQFCHEILKICTAVDVVPLPENLEKTGPEDDHRRAHNEDDDQRFDDLGFEPDEFGRQQTADEL